MNDFSVIGDACFAHRIMESSGGGKHCESLQRNVWRGVVSPLKCLWTENAAFCRDFMRNGGD